jgi:TRAP-type C4-dicarboxylate transport system permease small subunit
MAKLDTKEQNKLTIEIVRQMLTLATAGFGLVAALAWNSLIQEFVETYIKVWLPGGGKLTSLVIYAIVVTIMAVFVTYQLSKILRRLEAKDEAK